MTDTPKDLTAPEAVENLIVWLMDAHETGDTSKNPQVWRTLEALSAERLSVCQRESAMVARYDAKLDAAEARAEVAEAKLKEAVEVLGKIAAPAIFFLSRQNALEMRNSARTFLASLKGDKP